MLTVFYCIKLWALQELKAEFEKPFFKETNPSKSGLNETIGSWMTLQIHKKAFLYPCKGDKLLNISITFVIGHRSIVLCCDWLSGC